MSDIKRGARTPDLARAGTVMKSIEYLAGLFDGEGSFSIQVALRQHRKCRPSVHFSPSLSVNLYYGTEVLRFFQERFGGHIYPYKKGKESARWSLNRKDDVMLAAE